MSLFSKAEYVEVDLPYRLDDNPDDVYACILSIEGSGAVLGESHYYYVGYEANVEYYDELAALLKDNSDKLLRFRFKVKKGEIKKVELNLEYMAMAFNDERFKKLELLSWGVNDTGFKM